MTSGQTIVTVDAGLIAENPGIDIEKTTNGSSNSNPTAPDYDNEDSADGPGVPLLTAGSAVTWTYKVTNTGNVAFASSEVAIVDDNGTPASTADDETTANGQITFDSVQAGDSDNVLEPGEVWLYKATGTVLKLTAATGAATTFDFSGSSSVSGTAGNVRTFTSGSLSVKTGGFSRDKSSGSWSTAYLGSFAGGLGVTDGSEDGSSNTHTVDNIGRDNYVLFRFSENVVVDSTFLGYVVGDSDLKVWIGTIPNAYTSTVTLNESVLSGLGFSEVNLTDSSSTRTADLNAGNVSGNVLVIAADPGDTTPDDWFKVELVAVRKSQPGVYENTGTVTVPGDSDSDLSHYKNPVLATIGDKVWVDANANGVQDAGESGLAGVTVKLLNAGGSVVGTTTTDAGGSYSFTTAPGTYSVQFVAATGYLFSPADQGGNDATDSDANVTTGKSGSYTLTSGQNLATVDAGLYTIPINLSGRVFQDQMNDGLFETAEGDSGLTGVTIQLWRTDAAGDTLVATTQTGAGGVYQFANVPVGTYKLVEAQPSGLLDGKETAGTLGGSVDNSRDWNEIQAINVLPGGANSSGYDFAEIEGSGIQGLVWADLDDDGTVDLGESPISGVTVRLTGTDDRGAAVDRVLATDCDGLFDFTNLRPSSGGGYTLTETQPAGYNDGKDVRGTVNGVLTGSVANDVISQIALTRPGSNGSDYNFGERPAMGGAVAPGMTATIGYWHNKNGQALIKSLNGGSTATQLGNWLATTLPNTFGANAGSYNMAGKTNAQVAAFFVTLFNKTSSVNGPAKFDAQVLAAAFATYVTNKSLAGTTAASYGFSVSTGGVGTKTYDVGSANRAAFGLSSTQSTVMTVLNILKATDARSRNGLIYDVDRNGTISSSEKSLRTMANTVYTGINETGDIN